jgi:hypothetical protein
VLEEHRAVKGMCRPGGVLDFTNPREKLRDCCRKECTESKTLNNQRVFENISQGVHAGTLLEALSLQVEAQEG